MLFETSTKSAIGSQMALFLVCSVYHVRRICIVSREFLIAEIFNDSMVSGVVTNLRDLDALYCLNGVWGFFANGQ